MGPDGAVLPVGSTFTVLEGGRMNGKFTGKGMLTHSDGGQYLGGWKDGKYHGIGELLTTYGSKHFGEWKNGKCDGHSTITFSNGNKYEGAMKEGQPSGCGVKEYADGSSYNGEWEYGQHHGHGLKTWADGSSYNGQWKYGKCHCKPHNSALRRESIEQHEQQLENGDGMRDSMHFSFQLGKWVPSSSVCEDDNIVLKKSDVCTYTAVAQCGGTRKPRAKKVIV